MKQKENALECIKLMSEELEASYLRMIKEATPNMPTGMLFIEIVANQQVMMKMVAALIKDSIDDDEKEK